MGQLKISDLSVGDWVNQKMNDGAYQVQWIEREKVGLIKHTGTEEYGSIHLTALPLSFIEPIPLTPEILKKNGFRFQHKSLDFDHYSTTIENGGTLWLSSDRGGNYYLLYEEKGKRGMPQINCPLGSVHQLQHVLRLAGVEKEIEL